MSATAHTLPPPVCRRRWMRFSLRTLFLLLTGASVFLGPWVDRAERQRLAVAAIRNAGGTVTYDFQEIQWRALKRTPAWRNWFGVDYFAKPWFVRLPASATDADLRYVRGFTELRCLVLENSRVTDAGVADLSAMKNLTQLYLSGTRVGDTGLGHLAALANLEKLCLHRTSVSAGARERFKQAVPRCRIFH